MNKSTFFFSNIKLWQSIIKIKFSVIKKFFLLSITYFIINFNSTIFAKTVGNYIGANLVTTSINFQNVRYFENNTEVHRHTNPSSKQSYGLGYSYAVNYNNFFLSPGVIYEKNKTMNNLNRQSNSNFLSTQFGKSFNSVNKRYGVKLDFGYDINDEVAFFATIGKAVNYFKNYSSTIYYEDYTGLLRGATDPAAYPSVTENPFKITSGKKHALFYGGGFRIKIKNDWYLTGEYNESKFSTNNNGLSENLKFAPEARIVDGQLYYEGSGILYKISKTNKFKTVMKVYKLGISYNF